jgi:hypothetical protein
MWWLGGVIGFVNGKWEALREMTKYFSNPNIVITYLVKMLNYIMIIQIQHYVHANTTLVWALQICYFQNELIAVSVTQFIKHRFSTTVFLKWAATKSILHTFWFSVKCYADCNEFWMWSSFENYFLGLIFMCFSGYCFRFRWSKIHVGQNISFGVIVIIWIYRNGTDNFCVLNCEYVYFSKTHVLIH